MLHRLAFAAIVFVSLLGHSPGTYAEDRFALVLGNSDYQSVEALPNPVRDAKAISEFLESAGFDVTSALDLDQEEMRRAVQDFADKLADKNEESVTLIYFAGHGIQIDGQNYLVPVDAKITRESDVPLEAVRLADIMQLLDSVPSKTRIVILDACRNNPFDQIKETTGRGLAIVMAPAGSVVAYSTSPGATAEDGTGQNSPFTAALVEAGKVPGAPIETVLQNVRLSVHDTTDGRQTPWEVTALTTRFSFFPGEGGEVETPAPQKSADEWRRELRSYSPDEAYEIVVLQNVVVVYEIYLDLFPKSPWGAIIRGLMERRLEMEAWFDAVTLSTPEAFAAFLARYPESDLAPTAKRLEEKAKQRALFADNLPGKLDLPEAEAVAREEVVKEVPVEKIVVKEVPVEKIVVKEIIKEIKVPVEKVVVKEVKVPVIKEVIKEVHVPRECPTQMDCPKCPRCPATGSGPTIQINPEIFLRRRSQEPH